MNGRPPKPTIVKLQSGSKQPINRREPKHATIDAACPAELLENPVAADEWARVVGTLSRGHVTTVDRATLAAYCLKYAQWRKLEAEAAATPSLMYTASGYPVPSPAIGLANRACVLMLRLANELGLTPSSRSRVVSAPFEEPTGKDVDEFTAFQRRRRSL